jgi:hypothetical protein
VSKAKDVTARIVGGVMGREIENASNMFCPYCDTPQLIDDDGRFSPHYRDKALLQPNGQTKFERGICAMSGQRFPAAESAAFDDLREDSLRINREIRDVLDKLAQTRAAE